MFGNLSEATGKLVRENVGAIVVLLMAVTLPPEVYEDVVKSTQLLILLVAAPLLPWLLYMRYRQWQRQRWLRQIGSHKAIKK